jgi:hypothetical protein
MSTEQIKQEWTPEGGVMPVKPPTPSHLKQVTFRDEQDANFYHNTVEVTNGVVYIREMDDETYKVFSKKQASFIKMQEEPLQVEIKAREMEAENNLKEAAQLRSDAIAKLAVAEKDLAAFNRWLLEKTVAGWSFDRPFSISAFYQLRSEDNQLVVEEIVRTSRINREGLSEVDANFLADASLAS